jgi:hypothetical protein
VGLFGDCVEFSALGISSNKTFTYRYDHYMMSLEEFGEPGMGNEEPAPRLLCLMQSQISLRLPHSINAPKERLSNISHFMLYKLTSKLYRSHADVLVTQNKEVFPFSALSKSFSPTLSISLSQRRFQNQATVAHAKTTGVIHHPSCSYINLLGI